MRKIFVILFLFILSTTSVKSNNHQIKREGFLSKDFKITKLSTIENAENIADCIAEEKIKYQWEVKY